MTKIFFFKAVSAIPPSTMDNVTNYVETKYSNGQINNPKNFSSRLQKDYNGQKLLLFLKD